MNYTKVEVTDLSCFNNKKTKSLQIFYFQYIFTKHRAEINKSQLHSILIALHLLDCFPYFLQVLDETNNNNLLVQSCRIYLNCEYITGVFCSLANFGNKVTMPF